MKASRSVFTRVRGLTYHCRIWENQQSASDHALVLLHGWMDVSASFQFLVDALQSARRIIAPDWRGFGLTQWSGADAYWFPDYLADLDALLDCFSPDSPVDLLGHSMGGNVACLYAGSRPSRVRRLCNLEGFGLADAAASGAPQRYERWLNELSQPMAFRDYPDFAALAVRLQKNNPRLTDERAAFLARHWGEEVAGGRVRLRSDPAHKRVNPVQYRLDEARACWGRVSAPVLWVEGADTSARTQLRLSPEDIDARKAVFANLRSALIEQAGHMIHHDQPERLAALLEAFIGV